jgi:GDPmannose 4,6-dehydratase
MMVKTAIITGISGQDGAYLAQLLLAKKYRVIGLSRRPSTDNLSGLIYLEIKDHVIVEECDLTDISQIITLFTKYQPDEVYNLAAQSSVSQSFSQPIGTIQFNVNSVLNLLESIRLVNNRIKFYQASSSEMYGKVENLPITESTPFHPLSPYAISKAAAHWTTVNYREAFGLFTCCGVLFNHESYLRSSNFFIKKVLQDSIEIHFGRKQRLEVGNIDIKRDFGYAPDYVEAIWKSLQFEKADDYLICSGKSLYLREVIEHVFNRLNIPMEKLFINPDFYRPTDIEDIYGTANKAKTKLGWTYEKSFFEVLDILIEEELRDLTNG